MPDLRPLCLLAAWLAPLCGSIQASPAHQDERNDALPSALDDALLLDPELARRVRASEALVMSSLAELARWADEHQLYRERDRSWRARLELDPTDERALKALKFRRIGRDQWWPSPSYREPRNRGEAAELAQFERMRSEALSAHRQLLLGQARDMARPRSSRRELARRYLRVESQERGAHALLGEVWHEDRWLLFESRATLSGRSSLIQRAEACVERSGPRELQASERERGYGLPWRSGSGTNRVRVLGTMSTGEVRDTARLAHAAGSYFAEVFGGRSLLRPGFTIYLLRNALERDQLLAGYGVEGLTRGVLSTAAGGWIDADKRAGRACLLGEWDERRSRRQDGAVRQAMGTLLLDDLWIGARHGWAWEGVGLYLCYRLTGSRETWFFQPGESSSGLATPLWLEMQTPGSDWLALARQVLPSLPPNALEPVLARHLNQMSDEDLLLSYVLAGFLLEGRALETPVLLRRIGHGAASAQVFDELLDVGPAELQARLLRWLLETQA